MFSNSTAYYVTDEFLTPNGISTPSNIYHGPPTPVIADYVFLGILLILFLVGAPINLIAFAQLNQNTSSTANRRSGLHLLKIHLNLSDLLIIFVYTTNKICWLITYQWRGGELLCKLMQYLSSTTFQISSNIIVCIAFDRLLVILYKWKTAKRRRVLRISLLLAWLLAIVLNLPQFFIWTVISPYPGVAWDQCITVWHYKRVEMSSGGNLTKQIAQPIFDEYISTLFHLIVIFWLPFMLITICYIIVGCFLDRLTSEGTSLTDDANVQRPKKQQNLLKLVDEVSNKRRSSPSDESSVQLTEDDGDRRSSSLTLIVSNEIIIIKKKTIKISVLLVCAYVVCWLPYNALGLWHFFDRQSLQHYEDTLRILNALIILNSVINPFLYGMLQVFQYPQKSV